MMNKEFSPHTVIYVRWRLYKMFIDVRTVHSCTLLIMINGIQFAITI